MTTTTPFLTGQEIRDRFLQFYSQYKHQILPSASLVPEDPTVLLTNAGMLPFKPIFLGQKQSRMWDAPLDIILSLRCWVILVLGTISKNRR